MRQLVIRWPIPHLPAAARWDLSHYRHSLKLARSWPEIAALLPDVTVAQSAWLERQGKRGDKLQHLILRPHGRGSLMDLRLSSPLRPQSWLKDVYVPWRGPAPRWASFELEGQEAVLRLVVWDLPVSVRRSPWVWVAVCLALLWIPLQGMTHLVRPGETLSQIAQLQLGRGDLWPALYQANQRLIGDPHWIFPGQRLALPDPAPRASLVYTVRTGDSLWRIARRQLGNGGAWPRLYAANRSRLGDPHWILPGQVLRIPGGGHMARPAARQVRPLRRPLIRRVVLRQIVPKLASPLVSVPVTPSLPPVVHPVIQGTPPPVMPEPTPPPDPLFLEGDPLF